ncbi:MAG: winged helix-turn-helix domain-containing protein [Candidatus Geothermarchaeales archaeon]
MESRQVSIERRRRSRPLIIMEMLSLLSTRRMMIKSRLRTLIGLSHPRFTSYLDHLESRKAVEKWRDGPRTFIRITDEGEKLLRSLEAIADFL